MRGIRPFSSRAVISLIVGAATLLPVAGAFAATCTGDGNCRACKNCRYCKHCSREGGTCGVCKRARAAAFRVKRQRLGAKSLREAGPSARG